ncbi:hypothetical protein J2S90_001568 [Arthrobacter bambusae]|nr:hypothetical protein [Arthrobacter bambusae]MDQ0129429.1 hypothetical protein [Arthrobacter bambusae]
MNSGMDEGMAGEWTIIDSLLAGMARGWVRDRDVRSVVRGKTRVADSTSLRAMSIGVILELLLRGYAYPVFWDEAPWFRDPVTLNVWNGDPWEATRRIERLWWERRQDDMFLDIVWFAPTATGQRLGHELLEALGD